MSLPPRCVVDTCAVEDLQAGRFLRPFLAVTKSLIPDLLQDELSEVRWTQIHTWGVETAELSDKEVREVIRLSHERRALSPYDHAVVLVARRESVPILTSNFSHLPQEGQRLGVASFGVLRVVEELVACCVVDPSSAVSGIQAMREAGGYLPEAECSRLIAWLTAKST